MTIKRAWTPEDIAQLRELAGKRTSQEIASELGRTEAAVNMEASKLKVSLATRRAKFRRQQAEPLEISAR